MSSLLTTKCCPNDLVNSWNGGNLSMSLLKSERWFPSGIFAHKTLETGLISNADFPLFHDIIFLMNSNLPFKTTPMLCPWQQKKCHNLRTRNFGHADGDNCDHVNLANLLQETCSSVSRILHTELEQTAHQC